MPKKSKTFKILDLVLAEMMENLEIGQLNVTTSSKSSYESLSNVLSSTGETIIECMYGSGPLKYLENGNLSQTLIAAESQSTTTKKSYLVRAVGKPAFKKLEGVIQVEKSKLTDCKISSSQAIGGIEIPSGIDVTTLIQNAVRSQQTSSSKKLKISVISDGVFQFGTKQSLKYIQIAIARKESSPAQSCLCVISNVKESTPKFFPLLIEQNLDLGDIHALSLRDHFESLDDCDLKIIVISFLKQVFSLPVKDKLKKKKQETLPSRVKFVQTAFKSSLKYLDDDILKEATISVIEEYLIQLSKKGFSMTKADESSNSTSSSQSGTNSPRSRGRRTSIDSSKAGDDAGQMVDNSVGGVE